MESEASYIDRRISEISKEIEYLETSISDLKAPVTSEWGSGTYKKRKNRAYAGNHSMRVSEFEGRLESLKSELIKFQNKVA